MANGRDINVRLTVRDDGSVVLRNFGRQVERTSKRGEKSFNRMNRASTVASRGIRDLATSFGLLGGAVGVAAFALPITAAVRATNNLDVALSGLRAVSGATQEQMAVLEKQARSLGETTQFSASKTAEAQEFLARAGFAVNDILAATPATLDLAAAGNLNLARAADIASNVLQGFQKDATELNRVVDLMAATTSNANTNVEQMGNAMSFVAPVAQGFNVSIRETAAGIAILSNAGLQGQRAGTGLRRVLTGLASPSARLKDAMGGLSLQADGLVAVLRQLAQSTLSAEEAMAIFGQRGGPAFNILREGAISAERFAASLVSVDGAARQIAETRLDNLSGDARQLTSALEGLAIGVGRSGLQDNLRELTQNLTSVVRGLSSLVNAINGLRESRFAAVARNFDRLAGLAPEIHTLVQRTRELIATQTLFGNETRENMARARASAMAAARQILTTAASTAEAGEQMAAGADRGADAMDRLETATDRIAERQRLATEDAQAFARSQADILRAQFEAQAPGMDAGERARREEEVNEEIERLTLERFDRELEIARQAAGQMELLVNELVRDEARAAELRQGIAEDLAKQEVDIHRAKLAQMRKDLVSTLNEEQRLRELAARAGAAAEGERADETDNERLIRLREEATELGRIGASLEERVDAWERYREAAGGSLLATQHLRELEREATAQADELAKKAEEQADATRRAREEDEARVKALSEIPELTDVAHDIAARLELDDSEWQQFLEEIGKPSVHEVIIQTIEGRREGGPILRRAAGGRVPGGYGGGDKVRALLEPGEFVIRKEAVSRYGADWMAALNHLRLDPPPIRRQAGGPVGDVGRSSPSRDVVEINLSAGGERVSGLGDRELAEGLTRVLRGMTSTVAGGTS